MRFMYFFDDKIKPLIMRGKKYCNPAETGVYDRGVSCIREHDVNIWFYTKNGVTVAVDSGHLNFGSVDNHAASIGMDLTAVRHLFITHADVDHCGGIDVCGRNIFPNALVYIGEREEAYLNGEIHRMTKLGVKIYNCVQIQPGYRKLKDMEIVRIGDIEIRAILIPGHTVGHMCYIVDDTVLFSGDCLAINENGGYGFFDFFTQFPELNRESLKRLKKIVESSGVKYICTGHSEIRSDISSAFLHIDESAVFGKKHPFDKSGPWDFTR